MKITHPAPGYSGHVRVGTYALTFLAGVAHATNVPPAVRAQMEGERFTFEDDRPRRVKKK